MDAKFILRHICTITFFVFQAIFAHLALKLAKSVNITSQKISMLISNALKKF